MTNKDNYWKDVSELEYRRWLPEQTFEGKELYEFRPKLKCAQSKRQQTGWICRNCLKPCLTMWLPLAGKESLGCIIGFPVGNSFWKPFYGEIVED